MMARAPALPGAFVDPMAPREEVAEKMEDHRLSDQSTGAGHSLG